MTGRLLVAAALFTLAIPLASATNQAFPGKAGKLVFQSNRDGNFELYVANASGSGVKKFLSRPETDEFNANWSPSGSKLVFQTGPPDRSTYDIWTVRHDGKGAKVLVGGATNDRAPQFCDEKTVVFTRQLTPTNADVYAIGTNGKGLRRLTDHPASDSFPTCNPKGTRIAFITTRDGGAPRIYEMTRTGSGLRVLADGAVDPDYSSDGKALAYVAPDADRNLEVFVKTLATGAVTQRTNVKPPFEYRLPKFAPVSPKRAAAGAMQSTADPIVYATYRNTDGSTESVHKIAGGTAPTPVSSGSGASGQPVVPCTCETLTAEVRNHIDVAVKTESGDVWRGVQLSLAWRMMCTGGAGPCSGKLTVQPTRETLARGFRVPAKTPATIEEQCKGRCDDSPSGSSVPVILGAFLPASELGSVTIEVERLCKRELAPQFIVVRFLPNGNISERRSDLNGNGVLDGKEKKKP